MRLFSLGLAYVLLGFAFFGGDARAQDARYTIKPGDVLSISVWKEPELRGPVLVRPDGGFSFPLVGEVDARGKTSAELQQVVLERLKKYISDPVVTVSVQEVKGNKVFVIGQVNKPGEFVVNPSVDSDGPVTDLGLNAVLDGVFNQGMHYQRWNRLLGSLALKLKLDVQTLAHA